MAHSRPATGDHGFFATTQWGCWLFIIALAIVAAGSGFHLLRPPHSATYEGVLGEVSTLQSSPWRTSYNVVLAPDGGEPLSLRLRNRGPVLDYLGTGPDPQHVLVTVRQGVVHSLTILQNGQTISEAEPAPFLLAAATILPLAVLGLLAWPWLAARRGAGDLQRTVARNAMYEEEEE